MTEIKKAHDKFIRDLMSRKEVVQDFLRYYLDQKLVKLLDLSTLEIKKDTFVDQELVEHFSDILYQLKFRNGQKTQVYVLIEHKSYSDSLVAFQLLRYMIRIWELELKQQSKSRKPKKEKEKEKTARVPLGKEGEWIQAKLEFGEKEEQEQATPSEEQEESQEQKKLAFPQGDTKRSDAYSTDCLLSWHAGMASAIGLSGHLFRSSLLACPLCAQFSVFLV